MEGKYFLCKSDDPVDKHTHVRFQFTDGTELHYKDVRKFGTMHLFTKGEEYKEMPLADLGPEPFDPELTVEYLQKKLQKTNRKIKVALLDQRLLVGLGNIYVDEVLFRSGIYPEREASSLAKNEIEKIHAATVATLTEAVKRGGKDNSIVYQFTRRNWFFPKSVECIRKKGEPCVTCGTAIEKIVVGGRGTHYCPHCQPRN